MAETHATGLLRAGLLDGVRILVAGAPAPPSAPDGVDSAAPTGESPAMAVRGACAALGARVCSRVLAGGDAQEESAVDSMPALVEALADELAPLLDQPFAFYGLSMGGGLAWALAHRLRARGLPAPSSLYLASTAAPSLEEEHKLRWRDDLVGYLRTMGGTPPEVFALPEFLASLLPTLRADLTAVDSFRFRPSSPLDVPIHAFAGTQDAEGGPERMSGWRSETTARFDLDLVQGGHFFDPAGELRVIRTVTAGLLAGASSSR